jgi:hypothetical protein
LLIENINWLLLYLNFLKLTKKFFITKALNCLNNASKLQKNNLKMIKPKPIMLGKYLLKLNKLLLAYRYASMNGLVKILNLLKYLWKNSSQILSIKMSLRIIMTILSWRKKISFLMFSKICKMTKYNKIKKNFIFKKVVF